MFTNMLFCGVNIVFLWGFTLFGVKCLDTPGSGVFVFCSLIGSYVVSLTSLFLNYMKELFYFQLREVICLVNYVNVYRNPFDDQDS